MSHWAKRYIGLPYKQCGRDRKGLDCWGLVRLVYLEELGVKLPFLPGLDTHNLLQVCHEIKQEQQSSWTEVNAPVEHCAVAMSQKTHLHHVGIWTWADGGKVVHCQEGFSVIADTFRILRLKGFNVIKFFVYGVHC